MSEIITIMPARRRSYGILAALVITAAGFLALSAIQTTEAADVISDAEARAYVEEALEVEAERMPAVVLVGVGCGPDKVTIVLDGEEDEFPVTCEDIEAHGVAS